MPREAAFASLMSSFRARRTAFIALLDQAVMSGTTLLIGVLVARETTVEEFGGFALVLVLLIWVTGIHGALITTPYMYQWRKHPEALQAAYRGSVLIQHVTVVMCAVLIAYSLGYCVFPATIGGGVTVGVSLSLICIGALLRDYARMTAYAHQDFAHALTLDLGIAVFQLSTLLLVSAHSRITLSIVLLAVGIPQIILSAIALWMRLRPCDFRLHYLRSTAADHWTFGRWLVAGVSVNTLTRDAYPWLLATFFGVSAAGHYAAHANVAFLAGPAVIGLSNYLAPDFAKAAFAEEPSALSRRADGAATVIAVFALAYCVFLALSGAALSELLYGASLRGTTPIIVGLSVSLSIVAVSSPFGIGLYALGRSDVNFASSLVSLLVGAAVGIPLIMRHGLPGVPPMAIAASLVDLAIKRTMLRRLTEPTLHPISA